MSTLNGKLKVKQNGQYVVIHPETESSLITDFANAVTNTIPITTRANSRAYKVGDCVFVKGLPSWAYLECTQAGTTAAAAPSTITTTVTLDTAITDGTAKWIVRQYGIPSNPALRSIINNKIAADSLLYGTGANTFAITALSSLARTLIGKTSAAEMRTVIGARENKQLTSGDIQNFATEVISAIGAQTLSALGVKYSMTQNGYICFGQLFGGLILQWMYISGDESLYSETMKEAYAFPNFPINFNTVLNAVSSIKDVPQSIGEYCNITSLTNTGIGVIFGVLNFNGQDPTNIKKELCENNYVHILVIGS